MTEALDDIHIVRSALQNFITTLWKISLEMGMFSLDNATYREAATLGRQTTKKDTGILQMSSLKTSSGPACNSLMDVYVLGGSEQTPRHLCAFGIGICVLHLL